MGGVGGYVFGFYCRRFVPDLGFSSSRIYYQDPKFEKSDFSIFLFSWCSGSGCGILSVFWIVRWWRREGSLLVNWIGIDRGGDILGSSC